MFLLFVLFVACYAVVAVILTVVGILGWLFLSSWLLIQRVKMKVHIDYKVERKLFKTKQYTKQTRIPCSRAPCHLSEGTHKPHFLFGVSFYGVQEEKFGC